MSAAYNDYVLSTAQEQGWITPDQRSATQTYLTSSPTISALEFLHEQQLLAPEHYQWFQTVIEQAQAPAEADENKVVRESNADPRGFSHIDHYLQYALQIGASDIHLGPDAPALVRQSGRLKPLYDGAPMLHKATTEQLARDFINARQVKVVEELGSLDFCYEVVGLGRFRASIVRQRRGWEIVFRIINATVSTIEQLGLPEVLRTLTRYHNGLVLVTGAIGSGKSTTMAAMIEEINRERHDHIITLEDPIEYVFRPARCQISQREIHLHTQSFSHSLRAALREDPDVIMVGEMRDLETIALAITASETGHLVFGTLHTSSAARTLDRLLDVFPIEQQAQIRTMVSESIRGIISQQLVPRADGKGRVLAMEVMLNSPAVANLIRESKTFMLPGVIQTGRKQGMKLMDDSLLELLEKGLITADEAYVRSENKKLFAQELARRQS